VSNSSIFNIWAKVLKSLQDLHVQLNEREFQTAGALTLKAFADNVSDVRGPVSNSLSADLRQRPGLKSWIK